MRWADEGHGFVGFHEKNDGSCRPIQLLIEVQEDSSLTPENLDDSQTGW